MWTLQLAVVRLESGGRTHTTRVRLLKKIRQRTQTPPPGFCFAVVPRQGTGQLKLYQRETSTAHLRQTFGRAAAWHLSGRVVAGPDGRIASESERLL